MYWVSQDPEFHADVDAATDRLFVGLGKNEKLSDRDLKKVYKKLSNKYLISEFQTEYLISGIWDSMIFDSETPYWEYDKNKSIYTVEVWPYTTKDMYLRAWTEIKEDIRNKKFYVVPTKKKPSFKGQLLYAISKARRSNKSFPEIYKLYNLRKLEMYIGKPPTDFNSAKLLEDYYHKYSPKLKE